MGGRLAEIGSERQKRVEAEETRKAEKHKLSISLLNTRKQREEIKLANLIADSLPPDFNPSSLNSLFSGAAAQVTSSSFDHVSHKPGLRA